MADAVDSKSIVRKDVRVQLPPPAPLKHDKVTLYKGKKEI